MQEHDTAADFLVWSFKVVLILGFLLGGGKLVYMMGTLALNAQEHQMKWGQFSRSLWNQPAKNKK